jgi:hypothetical protein
MPATEAETATEPGGEPKQGTPVAARHGPQLPLPGIPIRMPTGMPGRVLWWGGLAAVVAFDVVEWPVAVLVGAGSWVAEQYAKAAASQQISRRGQALMRRTGRPAKPAIASTVDVRFTLPAEVQAGTVALCGEFNNWSAEDTRLERSGDGSWQATVALEPGRSYRYRYLLDGERWENAWHADCYVPNSYGSTDSVVIVE